MKKILKSLLCATVVSVSMLQSCSAFFFGSDAYTKEEYEKAGIKWEHHTLLLDNYYFNGKSISQSLAEKVASFYYKNEETIKNNNFKYFYMDAMEFAINICKDKEQEIKRLEIAKNNLLFENINLKDKLNKLQK